MFILIQLLQQIQGLNCYKGWKMILPIVTAHFQGIEFRLGRLSDIHLSGKSDFQQFIRFFNDLQICIVILAYALQETHRKVY